MNIVGGGSVEVSREKRCDGNVTTSSMATIVLYPSKRLYSMKINDQNKQEDKFITYTTKPRQIFSKNLFQ